MDELIKSLKKGGVLKSESLVAALRSVDRKVFVPEHLKNMAYQDTALPIGEGQTISQPYTVVFMLELLEPESGEKIMDIGHGSGWQTALLAHIVGKAGRVYAIERIESLCKFGQENVAKYPNLAERVNFYCQDAALGLPFSFNGIIAAAEVRDVPIAWREQLKVGGRLVYPKGGSIYKEFKKSKKDFSMEKYPGFAFVPFIKNSPQ